MLGIVGHDSKRALGAKKIGMRPDPDAEKRTNEIGTILPLLETVPDIAGHTVDALLTQRALVGRGAHYFKGNQPNMLDDIRLICRDDAEVANVRS